jgi:cell division protein FtsZ
MTMHETNEAVSLIMEAADEDAEIIFGTVIDDAIGDAIKITVVATGLQSTIKKVQNVAPVINVQQVAAVINTPVEVAPIVVNAAPPTVAADTKDDNSVLANSIREAALRYENSKQLNVDGANSQRTAIRPQGAEVAVNQKAKSIAEKLGFINFDEEELDKPTYLRNKETRI